MDLFKKLSLNFEDLEKELVDEKNIKIMKSYVRVMDAR